MEPGFDELFSFLLRRYTSVMRQYVGADPGIDIRRVLRRAEEVAPLEREVRLINMTYGGKAEEFVHGKLSYLGRLDREMRRVVRMGELLHVGKRATYGHGWFHVSRFPLQS